MPHGVSRCCWRLGLLAAASAQRAVGPVAAGRGWAVDHGYPLFDDDVLTMRGDSRLYLVEDHTRSSWDEHKYARVDLRQNPLIYTLDLSGVPCGCLACVYLVAMADPSGGGSNYCDSA